MSGGVQSSALPGCVALAVFHNVAAVRGASSRCLDKVRQGIGPDASASGHFHFPPVSSDGVRISCVSAIGA